MTEPCNDPMGLTVDAAHTEAQWQEGMRFCAAAYDRAYATEWVSRPDQLFVAREFDEAVATAGLELGRMRPHLDIEQFFQLSPHMRAFIDANRERVAELGRLASTGRSEHATRTVLHAVMSYCQDHGVEFVFACARPAIARHVAKLFGTPWWPLDAPVDEASVRSAPGLTAPPLNVFLGPEGTGLYLASVSFMQPAITRLAATTP